MGAAPYLARGGGGVLFDAPKFSYYDAFDDFAALVRAGRRGLVNPQLRVAAYHPLARSVAMRAPFAAMHIFLDDEGKQMWQDLPPHSRCLTTKLRLEMPSGSARFVRSTSM